MAGVGRVAGVAEVSGVKMCFEYTTPEPQPDDARRRDWPCGTFVELQRQTLAGAPEVGCNLWGSGGGKEGKMCLLWDHRPGGAEDIHE